MSIKEAVDTLPSFMLRDLGGVIGIKPWYTHYAQVQGQLMVTGAEFCDLVVYTYEDMFVQRILPNYPFMDNLLKKLSKFYKRHAMKYLIANNMVNEHFIM